MGGCSTWCMLYSVFACTQCMPYAVYDLLGVCLYTVCAVLSVCCAQCQLIIMTWRDRDG